MSWQALEDAFENNAPEVHSYLQLTTGDVVRVVDGVADPAMHARIMADPTYLHVDPVSSREQYRWMERFIESMQEPEVRQKLCRSVDGKGAFRRFKDVLMSYPVAREQWFAFRSERLRACMEGWLEAHHLKAVQRPEWRVPAPEEVMPEVEKREQQKPSRQSKVAFYETKRRQVHELIDALPVRELEAATAFLEFLRERRHTPRVDAPPGEAPAGAEESPESRPPDAND